MFVFLVRYKDSFSNCHSEFVNRFCYAVYDFIEDRKEIGDYSILKERHADIWDRVEAIAEESRIIKSESNLVDGLVNECIEGKHNSFLDDFAHYLVRFMRKD